MDQYQQFLERKRMVDPETGIHNVPPLNPKLFQFQRDIASWALRRGRAALFAGTGLGKSLMELSWAEVVAKETGKPILHMAPLAVSGQMVREAKKFGIPAHIANSQAQTDNGINITNYQKLDHFDPSKFGGVILDESSILKSTDGHYRTKLIELCASVPFRLAATATPAPNDFMELGNHAEFLGVMSYTDMLATFFTHDGGETQKWRLKGHAENDFWKWMASWAVMIRKPSDLGYANDGYELPPLRQQQHMVQADYAPSMDTGLLFPMEAMTLQERLAARRDTVAERVELAKKIVIGSNKDKLAECGNQNTPPPGKPSIKPTPPNERAEKLKAETPKKTESTCEPITGTTQRSLDNPTRKETAVSDPNTALEPPNMTPSSQPKTDAAPSVASGQIKSGASDYTSTTATEQDQSEGSSASTAIGALDSSATTQPASQERSNTSMEPWVIWCNLNKEQDALKAAFGDLAISIHGGQDEETKERLHDDWLAGKAPILIVKPSMFGHGLNWQHCCNMVFVGLNDSFEQVYQAIRRCWRFGQTKPVNVHFIAAETEGAVVANLRRKEIDADRMAAAMVLHMADLSRQAVAGSVRVVPDYNPTQPMRLPAFMLTDV